MSSSIHVGGRYRLAAESASPPSRSTEVRLTSWLSLLLPAAARERFVDEEMGNLRTCKRLWQRVDHLVGLAIGTPRLAWMMQREERRRRA